MNKTNHPFLRHRTKSTLPNQSNTDPPINDLSLHSKKPLYQNDTHWIHSLISWLKWIHFHFIHTIWLKLIRALSFTFFYPNEQFYHHILITGDDHAFGIGDWCTIGHKVGIANRLVPALIQHSKLRHTWRTLNLAQPNTNTRDWLPSTPLFKTTFLRGTSSQRNGDVIVLMLGMNDFPNIPWQETCQNLMSIAQVLSTEFAYVFIPTLPDYSIAVDHIDYLEHIKSCNQHFRDGDFGPISNICVGPDIDRMNSEYRQAKLYYYDHKHFSAAGYNMVAQDLATVMVNHLRKVEFSEEQKYIY